MVSCSESRVSSSKPETRNPRRETQNLRALSAFAVKETSNRKEHKGHKVRAGLEPARKFLRSMRSLWLILERMERLEPLKLLQPVL
jgi:hypothetical protein